MDVNKFVLIGFALLMALAIPIFFILNRYLDLRQTEVWLSQLALQRTATAIPSSTMTPTHTPTPTNTQTPTPTHTPSPTAIESLSTETADNWLKAYIDRVIHLDDEGPQTMVKIISQDPLEGEFRAEIDILWNTWYYDCFILGDEDEELYCLGRQLPETDQAVIRVYEILGDGEEEMVFEAFFEVPAVAPTETPKPRKTSPPPQPTNTPTNTPVPPTLTPTPTPTPSITPTNTLAPAPTEPWEPTPTP